MFTLSTKGLYGLYAMVALGMNYPNKPLQIREIAEAYDIPQHYLEQILVAMKKAGLVESYRGIQGGYSLTSDPSSIPVLGILVSLEGRLELIPEQKRSGPLEFFWSTLENEISGLLSLSLDELIQRKLKSEGSISYYI